jgi:hypothetical protein
MPTLFGNPTFDELDELIAAKDATIQAITKESLRVLPEWRASAPATAQAWATEWDALRSRYNAARALRTKTTSLALPPEVIWHRVMHSIRAAWDETGSVTQSAPESRGDLQDLSRRLGAVGGKPDFGQVPQPVATDPALELFKAADVLTRLALPSLSGLGVLLILWALSSRR